MKAKFADSLWSSKKHDYNTPKWLFDKFNNYYDFDTDPATTEDNPLGCKTYFTPNTDGLSSRGKWKGTCFINPPYDRKVQHLWVEEARRYSFYEDEIVVMLLPSRTDTLLWQNIIFPNASFICFIKGRLKFSGHEDSAPFGSALVVFHKDHYDTIPSYEKQLYRDIGRITICDCS